MRIPDGTRWHFFFFNGTQVNFGNNFSVMYLMCNIHVKRGPDQISNCAATITRLSLALLI